MNKKTTGNGNTGDGGGQGGKPTRNYSAIPPIDALRHTHRNLAEAGATDFTGWIIYNDFGPVTSVYFKVRGEVEVWGLEVYCLEYWVNRTILGDDQKMTNHVQGVLTKCDSVGNPLEKQNLTTDDEVGVQLRLALEFFESFLPEDLRHKKATA